jgi:hypothetical protein
MKKETKTKIKEVIDKYKAEAYLCLYPDNDYAWGTGKNKKKTLELMNKILSEVPQDSWDGSDEDDSNSVNHGLWRLDFMYTNYTRAANLIYKRNNHTAWVIEKKNGSLKFTDFDIGGS